MRVQQERPDVAFLDLKAEADRVVAGYRRQDGIAAAEHGELLYDEKGLPR